MFTPFTSKHFTSYVDPDSGVKMAVLSTRVSAVQQGLYFVNSGYSADGRYLWFLCAEPPEKGHFTGMIDFLTDEVRVFHGFGDVTGHYVDPDSGDCYFSTSKGIFRQSPNPDDKPIMITPIPDELAKIGTSGMMCHITFTPDKSEILVEYHTKGGTYIGSINLLDGRFTLWYKTEKGVCFDHAQCCPTDGNLVMCAREMWNDAKRCNDAVYENGIYPRINFITRDGKRHIIRLAGNDGGHEWWAPDGKHVYYVNNDYEKRGYGVVAKSPVDGGEPEIICKATVPGSCNHVWHAHCSEDEQYFVFDGSVPSMGLPVWRGCASTVQFFNKKTQKLLRFLPLNPVVGDWTPENPCSYHIDPHSRFVLNDTQITFTTTVLGKVDLAVVDVAQLIKATE